MAIIITISSAMFLTANRLSTMAKMAYAMKTTKMSLRDVLPFAKRI
jgi:hypothetical protein